MKNKPILEIKNLNVKVKSKTILSQINLSLNSGEIRVILGPNGVGKSTLLKAIMGLSSYQLYQGQIKFKNKKNK